MKLVSKFKKSLESENAIETSKIKVGRKYFKKFF